MPNVKLGKDAVVYYSETAGATLSMMNLVLDVANVELSLSAGEADVTKRSNVGWKQTGGTLKECEASFEIPLDTADLGYIAIRAAYTGNTSISLSVLTGPKNAVNEGVTGDFAITGFNRSEPIDGAVSMSVTAKLKTFTAWDVTVADTTPPTVVTVPATGATNVVVSANLTATFNEAINAADVVAGNFILKKTSDNSVFTCVLSVDTALLVVTINPTGSLAAGTGYTLIVANVRDAAGNAVATTTVTFTTAA